jgi:hypothetical protein
MLPDVVENSPDVELTEVVLKGYLSLLDPATRNWVNRWVSLSAKDMLMRVYDEQKQRTLSEDEEAINIVNIIKVILPDTQEHISNNTFMFVTPERVHEFRAKSKAMLLLWTEAINMLIGYVSS